MRKSIRYVLPALALLLVALALPGRAGAALTRPLKVTILSVDCVDDCDEAGLESTGESTPDFYGRVFIDGASQDTPRAGDNQAHITPNWTIGRDVSLDGNATVGIQIWDYDSTSGDDLADTSPQPGVRTLNLNVNLATGRWTGDVNWPTNCVAGDGDDDSSVKVCFAIDNGDADGDGLLDSWEQNGIDFNGDGTIDLPLNQPPFNANWQHKDLFVESDYMACSAGGCAAGDNHTHQPQPGTLPAVVNAFAAAPVANPDGANGITLHAMLDEAVPDTPNILFQTSGPGANDDFDDLKLGGGGACAGYFGTAADRQSPNCANILGAKKLVFRYMIFGHSYQENPSSSGISELSSLGGNDFFVTLGNFSAGAIAAAGGQQAAEAGTYMHELGHTLGLQHGGSDSINCKPNYLSIMSYSLQFANIDLTRPLDYSASALAALDETSLSEGAGIGGPAGRLAVFGRAGATQTAPANGAIDWNGVNGSGESGISGDVDFINAIGNCNTASPGETLNGYDDWQNLVYGFRDSTFYADGVARTSVPVELTSQQVVSMTPLADLAASKSVDRADAGPGEPLSYTVTVKNLGPGKATRIRLDDTLPDGSAAATRDLPDLLSGDRSSQSYGYTIPCSAVDGSVVTNTAKITGTNIAFVADPNPDNDSATAATTVHAPVLALSKSATPSVRAGEPIAYTLTYENTGSGGASAVTITDTLPAEEYYSLALDQGAGPKPASVVANADGTTTLTWTVGAVPAGSGPQTISYTARPSLLLVGGAAETDAAALSYQSGGCSYAARTAAATTAITAGAPGRNPLSQGYWRNHPAEWTDEVRARIQATDQRFDGADGSAPDGALAASEVDAVLAPGGSTPTTAGSQLLATYFNLATRRIDAGTAISSATADRLGLSNVRAAAIFAKATLDLALSQTTQTRYSDAVQVLDEINRNKSEQY